MALLLFILYVLYILYITKTHLAKTLEIVFEKALR